MKKSRALRSTSILAALTLASGCNAILDNEHGSAQEAGADVTVVDAAPPVEASTIADATTSPEAEAGVDAATDAGQHCPTGEKLCFGQCVSENNPAYGCDPNACNACKTSRASSVCAGGKCAIDKCDPGYADCNQKAADGCETDLSQPEHCGTCNAACQVGAPYCAPSGASFGCSTNCPAQAPTLCGTQCVDLNTSESHCGDCNTPCPVVPNGRETCASRVCQLSCDANFHVCGNACASNVDPATCGGSCTPCTAPANATATCGGGACGWVCKPGFHTCGGACAPDNDVGSCGTSCTACPSENATATCTGGACGFSCAANFGDCDKNPANACETNTQTDGANCGTCGHSCGVNPCVGGACQIPDAGPPDTGPTDAGTTSD